MKLQEIYKMAIELGMQADPRGLEAVQKQLAAAQKEQEKASARDKDFFDTERLSNPYADSRILHDAGEQEIRGVICGIDMEVQELLLADRLREKGEPIDLVFAHHPEGGAFAALSKMLPMQAGIMSKFGVLPNIAEGSLATRIGEVSRSVSPSNHNRSVMAAQLLNISYMCLHTPADNLVSSFVTEQLAQAAPQTVEDIIEALLTIPEYRSAAMYGNGPHIVSGEESRSAGKIYVDFTGGTSGSIEGYTRLAQAGVSTIVAMHCPEKHIEAAKKEHLNIVIAGHIASDSIGCNLILDELEKRGVKIYAASGLIRVARWNS